MSGQGRHEACHQGGFLNVEGALFMVGIFPVVVVDPVGYIGALLNLRHGDTGADGVEKPRRDVENVALFHGHLPADLENGLVLDTLAEFIFGNLMLQTII